MPSDDDLLEAARNGDDAAIGALLTRHAPAVYRFALKMCRDREEAKDVAQEALLAAARGLREFRGDASLSTWLYTVARSFCLKKRRTSKFEPRQLLPLDASAGDGLPSSDKAPDERAADREIALRLDAAIARLDPESREVLVLRDVEGLTALEVAKVVGTSVDAVKSRLHRARAAVRAAIESDTPHGDTTPSAGDKGCPDVVTLFSRYLEGEIGAAECQAMQAHVEACTRCSAACDSLRRTVALCRAETDGAITADVQVLVRSALRSVAQASQR